MLLSPLAKEVRKRIIDDLGQLNPQGDQLIPGIPSCRIRYPLAAQSKFLAAARTFGNIDLDFARDRLDLDPGTQDCLIDGNWHV